MTRLRFRYYMKLSFSDTVEKHRFSLKCIPKSDVKQHISITRKEVFPNSFISEGTDSFGNLIIYGYEENGHERFFFDIEGEAITYLTDNTPVEKGLSLFKYQTEVTRPGPVITEYFEKLVHKASDDPERFALYTMKKLGSEYNYAPGATDIRTKAEDALRCGNGVCQDYAHIMISLCRMNKIPCRYVTGMMVGEGKSHAWVEVFSGDRWIGMDPTNSQLVDDHYIKIAHGRDYSDCLVNQGVFTGSVTQKQEICVHVEEIY